MKKIVTLMLSASLMLSCVPANAATESRFSAMNRVAEDNSQIHILYNDKVLGDGEVKPVNVDGRVMIPFRSALEGMGASVEYDDAQKLVTAKKGATEIQFTLMDDTIYVDKGGEKSEIKMDVPMIVENGSTLVPIRFMSSAFDMQVGWEGDYQLVTIIDYSDCFDNIEEIAPNISKLFELEEYIYNSEYSEFDVAFSLSPDVDFSMTGKADSTYADGIAAMDMTTDISCMDTELKDVVVNLILNDSQIYVKTDLLAKLAQSNKEEFGKLNILSSEVWYKLDLNELLEYLGMPEMNKMFDMQSMSAKELYKGIAEMIGGMSATGGDVDSSVSAMLAAMLDAFEQYDKYVSVTEKDNGGYSIAFKLTEDNFTDILSYVFGSIKDDEDMQFIKDAIKLGIDVKSDCDAEKATSDAKVSMSFDMYGSSFDLTANMINSAKKDESVKAAEIPENAVNIMDMLKEF